MLRDNAGTASLRHGEEEGGEEGVPVLTKPGDNVLRVPPSLCLSSETRSGSGRDLRENIAA